MTKLLATLALVAGAWLIGAWFLMITVGVIHAEWFTALPPVGYGVALLISALSGIKAGTLSAVAGVVRAVLSR